MRGGRLRGLIAFRHGAPKYVGFEACSTVEAKWLGLASLRRVMSSCPQAANIPFVFGTGYGEALTMLGSLTSVPIVPKPYNRMALLEALTQMVRPAESLKKREKRGEVLRRRT